MSETLDGKTQAKPSDLLPAPTDDYGSLPKNNYPRIAFGGAVPMPKQNQPS